MRPELKRQSPRLVVRLQCLRYSFGWFLSRLPCVAHMDFLSRKYSSPPTLGNASVNGDAPDFEPKSLMSQHQSSKTDHDCEKRITGSGPKGWQLHSCAPFSAIGSIRYSHSKAMIGGGEIIHTRSGLGAVRRRQVSQPSRHSP